MARDAGRWPDAGAGPTAAFSPDAAASGAIVRRRLHAQRLCGAAFARPADVVGWFGAVQAQDFGPAKWSLGRRTEDVTDADVDRAFAAGTILRTHVLRPTWHFVLPADIRWLLTATAPRVQARSAYRYRQLGLDAVTLKRTESLLVAALRGGNELTRGEVAAMLTGAGVSVEGQRLPYILSNAELEALICSGPPRGKQQTYVLLAERAPDALEMSREDALKELARRFFTSHGPATAKDFATWASLTLGEVRQSLEAAGESLRREDRAGVTLWSGTAEKLRPRTLRSPAVHLVQGYDEYLMGYSETKRVLARAGTTWSPAQRPPSNLVVLLDGRVAGFWSRAVKKDHVVVQAALLEPFDGPRRRALEAEAARYGAFLGLRAVLRV